MEKNALRATMIREASFAPATIDENDRTVELVWTTGARVHQFSWSLGEFEEELEVSGKAIDLTRLNSGNANLLADHEVELGAVLGVVERAWIDESKHEGRAVVRFAKDNYDIDKVWNLVRQGILRSISVGYTVQEYETYIDGDVKIYRAVKWTPLELSAVTVPADAGATFRAKPDRETCIVRDRGEKKENTMSKREDEAPKNEDEKGKENVEGKRDTEGDSETQSENEKNKAKGGQDRECEPDEKGKEKDAEKERSSGSISRREYIDDICEVAGLSIKRARELCNSKMTIAEVREAVMAERSASFEPVSTTRAVNGTSTQVRKMGDFATERYKKEHK